MLPLAERNALILANRGIPFAVLLRLRVKQSSREELEAEAMLGLAEAAASYEPSKGAFSSWAWTKIHWRLLSRMAEASRRGPVLEYSEQPDDSAADPVDALAGCRILSKVESALCGASTLTRNVAFLTLSGLTKGQIASRLETSPRTVCRRRKQAWQKLAGIIKGD